MACVQLVEASVGRTGDISLTDCRLQFKSLSCMHGAPACCPEAGCASLVLPDAILLSLSAPGALIKFWIRQCMQLLSTNTTIPTTYLLLIKYL